MKSSLKARLGRLGPIRDVSRVSSGSPAILSLSPSQGPEKVEAVQATLALAGRGLSLLRAKRVIEEMLDKGRAVVEVPLVEDEDALARDLAEAGCAAARLGPAQMDVRALRDRLGVTQEQFAHRYGLEVDAVRNWETGRRRPDAAALAYLGVIARLPEQVSMALERSLVPAGAVAREAGRLRARAVGVMELLHPERVAENRRLVNSIPEARLGDVLRAAETAVAERIEAAAAERGALPRAPV
ncbi:helix-turn-helix domain-containing protein [Methylobacterium sp. Leaf99]|uniref:helix-turn-helix domain-containing protein n=1 Tax=Methylobacterium sp. Leaf99 TaxID=1736251 RepID=UPI000AF92295|nr:helix-turn-helix domain-containing protein [Methylobacterium sp. Leaf99]